MKARITTFLLLLTLMMMAAPQASALEIHVSSRGVISFYEDNVLGRNTNSVNPPSTSKAIKTVPASADKQLYIKPSAEETTIELREMPSPNRKPTDKKDFVPAETIKTDRVEMNFPAQLTADQGDKDEQGYLEKVRADRKERAEETIQIKNKGTDGQNMLEFKSRNTAATLKNGAEFILDPATNEIKITTPSGNEHILNHLPDQAIEKMRAASFFPETYGLVEELEVKTNDDGELIYTKKDKINKKLFGVFPREIDSEISLNDTTGEVTEVELAGDSIFDQFFNAVSF